MNKIYQYERTYINKNGEMRTCTQNVKSTYIKKENPLKRGRKNIVICDDVVAKIRDDAHNLTKKDICAKYDISYYTLNKLL
jgi:hypothetical protein